jgi:orotidine-5'-phosphate decarboxylase
MRILVAAIAALVPTALPALAQSDVDIKDDVATRFTRTKGASLLGQSVHWHVGAKVFHLPRKSRGGVALFVSQGIGILADEQSNAVEEVRRRGGDACVRGRVVRVPEENRAPGDPAYAVVVHSLSRRKHK